MTLALWPCRFCGVLVCAGWDTSVHTCLERQKALLQHATIPLWRIRPETPADTEPAHVIKFTIIPPDQLIDKA